MKNIKLTVLIVAFGLLIQAQTSFAQTVDERLKRAAAAIDKNNLDGATADLNEVFKVDSNNAWAYDLRGLVYYAKHNYEPAIADYTKAINLSPNAPYYYSNRGLAYLFNPNHDYKAAFYDFTSAIKIDPNIKDFYFFRGEASYYWELSDFGVKDFTQAIKLGMNTSYIYSWRAVAYLNQREFEIRKNSKDQI